VSHGQLEKLNYTSNNCESNNGVVNKETLIITECIANVMQKIPCSINYVDKPFPLHS
jgi:hypothetical protein